MIRASGFSGVTGEKGINSNLGAIFLLTHFLLAQTLSYDEAQGQLSHLPVFAVLVC